MIDTQSIRTKILDLAMRGQLTEQLSEDGTAEELYQQIQEEKQALIKAGKIKKEKPLPEIAENEVPFDIPETWKWVRLCELMILMSTGPFGSMLHKSDYIEQGIPVINPANIIDGSIVPSSKMLISAETKLRLAAYELHEGMIVMGRRGEMGRCAVVGPNEDGWLCGTGSFFMKPSSALSNEYISLIISSPYAKSYLSGQSIGMTMNNLNQNILQIMPVPLPPLAEQQRIVDQIQQAFTALDTIDELQTQYADNLNVLKSKLIDAAIQGQLTVQLPEDGTAEELYQIVQTERKRQEIDGTIKQVELAPEITDKEKPFDIPKTWKWTHLGNICYIVRGGSPRPIKEYITTREDGINWIKIGDVEKGGKYIYSTHEKIIPEGESKSRRVYPGDFLLTNSMSFGRPYISKIEGCIHDGWLLIHGLNGFEQDYLYYLLSSKYLYNQFTAKASGSTVENLNIDKVKAAIIPLPPLAEQKRIIARLEELLPLCEKLK